MMSVLQLKVLAEDKLNRCRRIRAMLDNPLVERHTSEELESLIDRSDVDGLRHWIQKKKLLELETTPVVILRRIAKSMGILRYNYLDKEELLNGIRARREQVADSKDDIDS